MKLRIEPPPTHKWLHSDLELVICLNCEKTPEVFIEPGEPKPDRHLLLGIAQSVVVAVEERDTDLVEFARPDSMRLDSGMQSKELACDFVIFRTAEGRIGALAPEDTAVARTLARKALRWFTGAIRLDVP